MRKVISKIGGLEIELVDSEPVYGSPREERAVFKVTSLKSKATSKTKGLSSVSITFNPLRCQGIGDLDISGDGRIRRAVKKCINDLGDQIFCHYLQSLIDLAAMTVYTVTFDANGNKDVRSRRKVVLEKTVLEYNEFFTKEDADDYDGAIPVTQLSLLPYDFKPVELDYVNFEVEKLFSLSQTSMYVGDKFKSPAQFNSELRWQLEKVFRSLQSKVYEQLARSVDAANRQALDRTKELLAKLTPEAPKDEQEIQ